MGKLMYPAWDEAAQQRVLDAYRTGSWAAVFALYPSMNRHTAIARTQRLPGYRQRRNDWTTNDERQVVSLWNAGLGAEAIGKRLGRSKTAVEMKIAGLRKRGVALKRKTSSPVTVAQKRVIAAHADQIISVLVQRFGFAPATMRAHLIRAIMNSAKRERRQELRIA